MDCVLRRFDSKWHVVVCGEEEPAFSHRDYAVVRAWAIGHWMRIVVVCTVVAAQDP